jgi:hypothetical protein
VSCLKDLAVKGYAMKRSESLGGVLLVLSLLVMLACTLLPVAQAQGLPVPITPANMSSDWGGPRGDTLIPVSSGMLTPFLPKIPNLELGFLYSFGKNVRTGRFTADYVLPFKLSADSVLFGEAHAEGWDFWKKPSVSITSPAGFTTTTSSTNNRVDLSFGGGYRTMLGDGMMLGANGFYDASRLYNRWYSSGGIGLEMAATVGGDDAVDLNFNWYGNLFNRDVLVNAFRNKGNSFDVEAGYSHALFNQALDLRLKLIGYQFDIGTPVRDWRGGADLTTRNGMFTLRYEYGNDKVNGYYNTVGGFVNVGFQMENLLSGESPFSVPEPVFRSPRDLRRLLGLKVKRNWYQPEAVAVARNSRTTTTHNGKCVELISHHTFSGSGPRSGALITATLPIQPPLQLGPTVAYIDLLFTHAYYVSQPLGNTLLWLYVLFNPEFVFSLQPPQAYVPVMTNWEGSSPNLIPYQFRLFPSGSSAPGDNSNLYMTCMFAETWICRRDGVTSQQIAAEGTIDVYGYVDCP